MTWVKLDDGFCDHPKVALLPLKARWTHLHGLCYCNRFLTDGLVPVEIAHRWEGAGACVTLVNKGVWKRHDNLHYEILGYLEWNPSKDEVEWRRTVAAQTKEYDKRRKALTRNPELVRAIKERDQGQCRYCGVFVNWRDRKGPQGGSYDHVIPITKGGSDEFDNIVVACRDCNGKKGSRTPEEAGMQLRDVPAGIKPESGPNLVVYEGEERSEVDLAVALEKEEFETFWKIYPRHDARAAAEKAWPRARKAASLEAILAGAERYRDDPNREEEFTAHGSTWLNGRRWNDPPQPPRGSRRDRRPDRAAEIMKDAVR